VRASFQTGVTNKKIIRHAPNENNGITGSRLFYIKSFSPFFLISRSLIRKFILGFSCVRASFQTDVNNKIKLDMHRTRITALREVDFFI